MQVPCVATRMQSRSVAGQSECAQLMVAVSEMRAPMAEGARRCTHPSLTSQAEMTVSGAVLGDLRDYQESSWTRWVSLDLMLVKRRSTLDDNWMLLQFS